MGHREIFLHNVGELAAFICNNRTYPLPNDLSEGTYCDDPRAIHAGLETLASRLDHGDRFWDLKASSLELFLRKAPELREMMLPIAHSALNISREAVFDPLTFHGLNDALHFVSGGLLDDAWFAMYAKDGERRIVNESIDDAIQLGGSTAPHRVRCHLDKDDEWLAAADRRVLSERNYYSTFGDDLHGISPRLWTQDDLTELWYNRPYADFSPPTLNP